MVNPLLRKILNMFCWQRLIDGSSDRSKVWLVECLPIERFVAQTARCAALLLTSWSLNQLRLDCIEWNKLMNQQQKNTVAPNRWMALKTQKSHVPIRCSDVDACSTKCYISDIKKQMEQYWMSILAPWLSPIWWPICHHSWEQGPPKLVQRLRWCFLDVEKSGYSSHVGIILLILVR